MDAYYVNIKNVSYDREKDYLLRYVDEEKRKKALRYVHDKDKIRTLIGDILVRTYMCKYYNYNNSEIKYEHNEFNKPYIADNANAFFNISHSGDYVAVAFDNEAIGIDVEEIKEIEFEDIAEKFFTENESSWIMKQDFNDRIKEFYKLWTLKESYVKFKGKGLNIPFNSFSFKFNPKSNIYSLESNKEKLYFVNYEINDSYELSLCSKENDVHIKEITYKDLINAANNYL